MNREFKLKLKPTQQSHFKEDFVEVDLNKTNIKPELIVYEGYLLDEPDSSSITGYIINGLFIGTINTAKGKYFVEPSLRYNSTANFNSIVYHETDLNSNEEVKAAKKRLNQLRKNTSLFNADEDAANVGISCGSVKASVKQKLDEIQKKAVSNIPKQNVNKF